MSTDARWHKVEYEMARLAATVTREQEANGVLARRLARAHRTAVAAVAVAVLSLVGTPLLVRLLPARFRTVATHALTIEDQQGRPRGTFEAQGDWANLTLVDEAGKPAITLRTDLAGNAVIVASRAPSGAEGIRLRSAVDSTRVTLQHTSMPSGAAQEAQAAEGGATTGLAGTVSLASDANGGAVASVYGAEDSFVMLEAGARKDAGAVVRVSRGRGAEGTSSATLGDGENGPEVQLGDHLGNHARLGIAPEATLLLDGPGAASQARVSVAKGTDPTVTLRTSSGSANVVAAPTPRVVLLKGTEAVWASPVGDPSHDKPKDRGKRR